ncbi:MAG: response regulator [Planctomycetota bacterium]|nr:response regulator [Planctomycetota bacterium]
MQALFIDHDPVVRGLFHCFATMAGLDHAIAARGADALELLRGAAPAKSEPYSVAVAKNAANIAVVVTEIDLPDLDGIDLARLIRANFNEVQIFAHTYPERLPGGESFDRVFFKPHAVDAVVRAALAVIGGQPEQDLFQQMIPHASGSHAA